jgi:hypothetical protein
VAGTERRFTLERVGGRRWAVLGAGGEEFCTAAFLGPVGAGVDLLRGEGPPLATVRGGTMAVRDYHVALAGGERLRVYGGPDRWTVESDRQAATEVLRTAGSDGRRTLSWRRDGGCLALLVLSPGDPGAAPEFEVPAREDPVRGLAVLLATEGLRREEEGAAAGERPD